MRYLFGFLCVCALGVVPWVGCTDDYSQCNMIDEATCWCTEGGSCAFECGEDLEIEDVCPECPEGTEVDCNLWCNPGWYGEIRKEPCTLDAAAHSCTMLCQGGMDCTANCGDDSMIACQFNQGRCEASVGDNALVACEGAEFCDIECRGSCWVGCELGTCQVRCADPEECTVRCSGGIRGVEGTLCPDGKTKVCAMECPGETPTERDVGAFEVQP
jgi:hypothetical protein